MRRLGLAFVLATVLLAAQLFSGAAVASAFTKYSIVLPGWSGITVECWGNDFQFVGGAVRSEFECANRGMGNVKRTKVTLAPSATFIALRPGDYLIATCLGDHYFATDTNTPGKVILYCRGS